jgi:hypothetical protein
MRIIICKKSNIPFYQEIIRKFSTSADFFVAALYTYTPIYISQVVIPLHHGGFTKKLTLSFDNFVHEIFENFS